VACFDRVLQVFILNGLQDGYQGTLAGKLPRARWQHHAEQAC
jgi:hypothetical protein